MKELLIAILFYTPIVIWLKFVIYNYNYSEFVTWLLSFLGALVLTVFSFVKVEIGFAGPLELLFTNIFIWSAFGTAMFIRFIKWILD